MGYLCFSLRMASKLTELLGSTCQKVKTHRPMGIHDCANFMKSDRFSCENHIAFGLLSGSNPRNYLLVPKKVGMRIDRFLIYCSSIVIICPIRQVLKRGYLQQVHNFCPHWSISGSFLVLFLTEEFIAEIRMFHLVQYQQPKSNSCLW